VKLTAAAAAKINLALVVGERRADGHHEVATVLQRIDICDRIELEPAATLAVDGFRRDTLVSAALTRLAAAADTSPRWRVCLRKQIPIAAGLGGGSADAAAALTLANATLSDPLDDGSLHELAATLGADVPFFLRPGPKLAEGAGERLSPLDLPQDFWVLLALPRRAKKGATGDIYRAFDQLGRGAGFAERKRILLDALEACRRPRDFAAFPPNDLAPVAAGSVAFADQLRALGAFRADVSGAGPAVYGLFQRREHAVAAARRLRLRARVWVTAPVW
jgi:4-diphosphocytidyl-2-C-methyl-D-erythritol kinase